MSWLAAALAIAWHAQVGNAGRQAYLKDLEEAYFVKLPALLAENGRLERSVRQTAEVITSLEATQQQLARALHAQRVWHDAAEASNEKLRAAMRLHAAWGPQFAAEGRALTQPWAAIRTPQEVDAAWRVLLGWQGGELDEKALVEAETAAAAALHVARSQLLDQAQLLCERRSASVSVSASASTSTQFEAVGGEALGATAAALVEAATACETQRVLIASMHYQRRRLRDDLQAAMRTHLRRRLAVLLAQLGEDALQSASMNTVAGEILADLRLEFATDNAQIGQMVSAGQCREARRTLRVARHRVEALASWSTGQNWPLHAREALHLGLTEQRSRLALLQATADLQGPQRCQ